MQNLNNASDNIQFEVKFTNELTKEKFIELCDIVEELQNAGTLCGHPYNHPLKEITPQHITQQIETKASRTNHKIYRITK